MIIVKLMGGLGNQMFQYSVGRRLALKHNTKLYLDITGYEQMSDIDTPREYELDCYTIQADIAQPEILAQVQPPDTAMSLSDKALRRLGKGNKIWQLGESDPPDTSTVLNAPDNTYLVGWWQNEVYFKDVRDTIAAELTPKDIPNKKNQAILDQIVDSESVGLHVRRGDYISNKHANVHHGLTPLEYYSQAVAYIKQKVKDPRFFVFSDDLDWCKQNFELGKNAVFVEGNSGKMAYEDIRLMKHCKHNVIANSSFSWWGAWLNSNPHKIVIAPQQWLQDEAANKKIEIVPPEWIRI